jgi:hypothetical protein
MAKTNISSIKFKKDRTEIKFKTADQPRGYNEIVEEKNVKVSDLIRHADFVRALERFAPHLLIAGEFTDTFDRIKMPIDKLWFDEFRWKEDGRYEGVEVTGIIINGRDNIDGIQIIGYRLLSNGEQYPLKTPSISLLQESEGTDYPLRDILSSQIETLLTEAEEWLKGVKTGATKQMEMQFDSPKLSAKPSSMYVN